jgi:hypothetical protein
MNIEKKWTSPLQNWSLIVQQLYIKFGQRVPLELNPKSFGASPKGFDRSDRVQITASYPGQAYANK